MLVWRLCRAKYRKSAFSGDGARIFGGRWNLPGVPAVYTAATLSLAVLEYLAHFDPEDAPEGLIAIAAEVPEQLRIHRLTHEQLPDNWRQHPAPRVVQKLGTEWAKKRETAILQVPSVVVPHEALFLLNPVHEAFDRIRILEPEPFSIDARILAKSGA